MSRYELIDLIISEYTFDEFQEDRESVINSLRYNLNKLSLEQLIFYDTFKDANAIKSSSQEVLGVKIGQHLPITEVGKTLFETPIPRGVSTNIYKYPPEYTPTQYPTFIYFHEYEKKSKKWTPFKNFDTLNEGSIYSREVQHYLYIESIISNYTFDEFEEGGHREFVIQSLRHNLNKLSLEQLIFYNTFKDEKAIKSSSEEVSSVKNGEFLPITKDGKTLFETDIPRGVSTNIYKYPPEQYHIQYPTFIWFTRRELEMLHVGSVYIPKSKLRALVLPSEFYPYPTAMERALKKPDIFKLIKEFEVDKPTKFDVLSVVLQSKKSRGGNRKRKTRKIRR